MSNDELVRKFLEYQPMLRGFTRYLIHDAHDADDLFQEAAMVILKGDPLNIPDGVDPVKWFRGIIRNLVRHHWHMKGREKVAYVEDFCDLVEAAYEGEDQNVALWNDRRLALQGCLETLPPRSRSILSKYYAPSPRIEELTRQLRCTLGALRVRILRIRGSLMACMAQRMSEEAANG